MKLLLLIPLIIGGILIGIGIKEESNMSQSADVRIGGSILIIIGIGVIAADLFVAFLIFVFS